MGLAGGGVSIRLEYPDKYRLWNDLVRGNTDRLFLETDEAPKLGSRLPVELVVPGLVLPIVLESTVIGRRRKSEKFPPGIYLRFGDDQIEVCRRFLGLEQAPQRYDRGRKAKRITCELPVRFLKPAREVPGLTKNLSETGMLVRCPAQLVEGQRVEIALGLDDASEVELHAEVSWAGIEGAVGLRFLDPTEAASGKIRACLDRLEEARRGLPQPRTVVVADDDPDILQLLTVALSRSGYEVYQARNGEEALELVRELQPRLLLLDILMPRIDGVDICKMMRADVELVDVPTIFVSALDEKSLHAVADEAGATDYLSKPVALADLLNMVGRYLRDS